MLLLIAWFGWLAAGCAAHQEAASHTGQPSLHIGDSIQLRTFVMDATHMFPLRSAAQGLTGEGYAVQVRGSQLRSILPYRGRAYRSSMDLRQNGPLHFDAPVSGYTAEKSRNGEWWVHLEVRNGEEQFHYAFRITPQGKASLKVSSPDRDWILFEGTLRRE